MADDFSLPSERRQIVRYEVVVPVRGCHLSLTTIKTFYLELLAINRTFGEKLVSLLDNESDMTAEQWNQHKAFLLNDAFCITTTIRGLGDQIIFGRTADIFDNINLPKPIQSIYLTNITAFSPYARGDDPNNSIEVLFDFTKPNLFDANPLVSEATENDGNVTVKAGDIAFFNAVQNSVEKLIKDHKHWYSFIHRNFAYDFGLWFFALPISLYFSAYFMDRIIPSGSEHDLFRWPLFGYFVGLSLIIYRGLIAYAKWAFPVNTLKENHDKALTHRLAIGAVAVWLLYGIAGKIFDTFFSR